MQLVFSDAQYWHNFLPLTFTRPVAELRCGILTFAERWKKLLDTQTATYLTEDYLQIKFQTPKPQESLFIIPNFLPTEKVLNQIKNLKIGEALVYRDELLAARVNMDGFSLKQIETMTEVDEVLVFFEKHTDLFSYNEQAINFDFDLLTRGRTSQPLSLTNGFLGNKENLFIEEGAEVEFSTLNCRNGKIYIGKNVEIMEGSHLRAPIALCEHSILKLGTKIYGATTIGPHCKFGGEIGHTVVLGYSSKGHDGYIGNSVIGEWCNMGAGTSSSNLKNNYGNVKLWNYQSFLFEDSGLQFVGVIMGDHTKTAINTKINTGTVMGVTSNIFTSEFPPNQVESFSWGGMKDDERYRLDKAFEVMQRVMYRRNRVLSEEDKEIMAYLYNQSS